MSRSLPTFVFDIDTAFPWRNDKVDISDLVAELNEIGAAFYDIVVEEDLDISYDKFDEEYTEIGNRAKNMTDLPYFFYINGELLESDRSIGVFLNNKRWFVEISNEKVIISEIKKDLEPLKDKYGERVDIKLFNTGTDIIGFIWLWNV